MYTRRVTQPFNKLLSQVLVAFTIEFDNEFADRMAKTFARPFGVSLVMWSNFMRFVHADGTPVEEIAERSGIPQKDVASVVGGMERWGYITVDHDPSTGVPPRRTGFGSAKGVKAGTRIFPSQVGSLALERWEGLPAEIESRWRSRMGDQTVDDLRDALTAVGRQIELVMPHFLPIIGSGGSFTVLQLERGQSEPDDDLPALLSRVLLPFTLDYESHADISLALSANLLRVLDDDPIHANSLPLATGTSKEAVSMSTTWLVRNDYMTVEPNPDGRGKVVRRTPKGAAAQDAYRERVADVEAGWRERCGSERIDALRSSHEAILNQPGGEDGPLSAGLVTPPGGWRSTKQYKPLSEASIADPAGALPHHPMVLHRGGWPDGS